MTDFQVAVIGAGAAGMTAAGRCASAGLKTVLFDSNPVPGVKLRITGKGRCNLTNNCSAREYTDNAVTNRKFLFSAAAAFPPSECMAFFEGLGVKLKTERGGRVFPVSDRADEVAAALARWSSGAKYINSKVRSVSKSGGGFALRADKTYSSRYLLIATGGMSYPSTGSCGDGYRFAESLGHTVVKPRPSLVPLLCAGDLCRDLQGLTLRNVRLSLIAGESKPVFSELGELLFTHFGVSGPLALSASAHLGDREVRRLGEPEELMRRGEIRLSIDLKPGLTAEQLSARILRDLSEAPRREFKNSLSKLLPVKLIFPAVRLSGIPGDLRACSVTAGQRAAFAGMLKDLRLTVTGTRPISEAVVTAGGVCTDEINPSTMESKLCGGLFFAGEVIDVDCYTGGYNLQTAFCTAVKAADAIILKASEGHAK